MQCDTISRRSGREPLAKQTRATGKQLRCIVPYAPCPLPAALEMMPAIGLGYLSLGTYVLLPLEL